MQSPRLDEFTRRARARYERRRRRRSRRNAAGMQAAELYRLPSYETGPPDFVGMGVHRSGTTWWYGLLRAHPEVWRPRAFPKECHFFNPYWRRPFEDEDVRRYHELFPRPPGRITGEWTPRYLSDFWTAPLLRRAAPAAKVLVILRDPVARYRSGLAQELALSPNIRFAAQDQFARGLYHAQLTRLLRHFERERLLLLQLERCVREPESELTRTYAFLGVDPDFVPDGLHDSHASVRPPVEIPPHVEAALRTAYAADVLDLCREFPELDASLWPTAVAARDALA